MITTKREKVYVFLILSTFFFVMLYLHVDMRYISDDIVNITTDNKLGLTIGELISHYFFTTGKILTDVLGNLLYRISFPVWKITDSFIYVIMAIMITYIFSSFTPIKCTIVCLLILLYPKYYLSSAGYILTTTNYIYTIFSILIIFTILKSHRSQKLINIFLCIPSILYATNQDQSAMALIGSLFLYFIYLKSTNNNNTIQPKFTFILLCISIAAYITAFMFPGHLARASKEVSGIFCIPNYNEWTLLQKVYHGYSTTAANFIFKRTNLYICAIVFIFILSLLSKKKINIIIASFPVALSLLIKYVGESKFIYFYDYCYEVADLRNIHDIKGIITFVLSVTVIFSIFFLLFSLPQKNKNKFFCIAAFIIGGGTRIMMGFSATLYGSSMRTCSLLLYSFIIIDIVLYEEIIAKDTKYAQAAAVTALGMIYLL